VKRTALMVGVAAALLAAPGAMAAGPVPECVNVRSAVHVFGQGPGGTTITCSYTAFGRGGVEAATPNAWEVVGSVSGVLACSDSRPECSDAPGVVPPGLAVQSVESVAGETVTVRLFAGSLPGLGSGTFGGLRVGGVGALSCDPGTPTGCV